jgi:hypothetical protein
VLNAQPGPALTVGVGRRHGAAGSERLALGLDQVPCRSSSCVQAIRPTVKGSVDALTNVKNYRSAAGTSPFPQYPLSRTITREIYYADWVHYEDIQHDGSVGISVATVTGDAT